MSDQQTIQGKRILVAPLDWGLGHATRCIPIIDSLLSQKAEVFLAGAGRSRILLQNHYPHLEVLELPGYDVQYSSGRQQIFTIGRQIPRLISVIRKEKRMTDQWVNKYQLNGIISDNRYGVWSEKVPSVFISHQLSPALPGGMVWLRKTVHRMQMQWLKPFSEIWVPDFEGEPNLSGNLSHISEEISKLRFIGPLSRFQAIKKLPDQWENPLLQGHSPEILVVLSGPEPQRSILEKMIYHQAQRLNKAVWIVKGKTELKEISQENHITHISHLSTHDLCRALKEAEWVISRSGYSSIMDFYTLGIKNLVLIPTPGQTEQEYLAKQLKEKKITHIYEQSRFDLARAIENPNIGFLPNFPEAEIKLDHLLGDFFTKCGLFV